MKLKEQVFYNRMKDSIHVIFSRNNYSEGRYMFSYKGDKYLFIYLGEL